MARTVEIKNVTKEKVGVAIYASFSGNVRQIVTLEPGEAMAVTRVTPEARELLSQGILSEMAVSAAGAQLRAEPAVADDRLLDPMRDCAFIGQGSMWGKSSAEPVPVTYDANIRTLMSNDRCGLLASPNPALDVDFEWWNAYRGPHFQVTKHLVGDFEFSCVVDAEFKKSAGNDWAGVVLESIANPYTYAIISIKRDAEKRWFSWACQKNYDISSATHRSANIKMLEEEGPHCLTKMPGLAYVRSVPRICLRSRESVQVAVNRVGPLVGSSGPV